MSDNHDIKEYIDQRDSAVEQKIKLWILSSLIAQILALAPIIFFLGGIYQNANTSLKMLEANQVILKQSATWMEQRERWEMRVQEWAETKGFRPSPYAPMPSSPSQAVGPSQAR